MESKAPLNILASLLLALACFTALVGRNFFYKMQNYIAQYYDPNSPDALANVTELGYQNMQLVSSVVSVFSISFLVVFPAILSILMFKRKKPIALQ